MAPKQSRLPQHTHLSESRVKDNKKYFASAPYNFVPLPQQIVPAETVPPDHDLYQNNTGWVECEIETLTPLYTRGLLIEADYQAFGDKEFHKLSPEEQKRRAEFFAINGRATIPGSSLRGMTRALVEIAGFGKVTGVSDRQMIFRAVGDPSSLGQYYRNLVLGENQTKSPDNHFNYPSLSLHGGYLRESAEGWLIQPALEHLGETFIHVEYEDAHAAGIKPSSQSNHLQTTHPVYVIPSARRSTSRGKRGAGFLTLDVAIAPKNGVMLKQNTSTRPQGMQEATLVVSGHMGGGHQKHWHCAIYAADSKAKRIPIPQYLWDLYEEDRDMTRGIRTRKLQKDGDPLFYLTDGKGKLIFWGPTQMFRIPFGRSAKDFVPNSLLQESDVDIAEALFGYIKSNHQPYGKKRTYAGRVFFEDARSMSGQGRIVSDDMITPAILGSPKPSTFQHYLTQPDEAAKNKLQLKHYASDTPEESVIRGNKIYWHKRIKGFDDVEWKPTGKKSEDLERKDAEKQLTGIKPVKVGVKFAFRIRFENLSDVELGALLWSVDLPEGCAHKLGMGKPLGLGSVRLNISSVHLTDRANRYSSAFVDAKWNLGACAARSVNEYKSIFESYVLARIDPDERNGAQRLAEVSRVHELLTLLSFENAPATEKTRYLEIEHKDNGNEYKERPVLPLPSVIAGRSKPVTQNGTTNQTTNNRLAPMTTLPAANTTTAHDWRNGIVIEIRPDKRSGRVRDAETQKEYRFSTDIVIGNTPANKSGVLFSLQQGKVVALKRR